MPLSRYQVRNEYSLADPELYRAADKDDPEALLEGVAMAGLVGVLRQLGDLAEFAAEIFHDLHEEVMVTAARGHTLLVRVQQLESEFPLIEKAILSQTSHSAFYGSTGIDWHPNLQTNQNLITKGDLPRFVMDSYEECRGPPRLFLLDKFDVAGAGACLKRYTDPSFYKVEASAYEMASTDVQRDKRIRKAKKKGPRWKNGEIPEVLPSTKLHQLFLEERVENGASDPARLVKLKRKPNASALGSDNGKSYMEKFLKTPEDKVVCEVIVGSPPSKSTYNSTIGSRPEVQVLDISTVESDLEPVQRKRSPYPPPSLGTTISRLSEDDFCEDFAEEGSSELPTSNPSSDDKDIAVNGEVNVDKREIYQSDNDNASEIDNYTDALATLESEVETDIEFRAKSDDVRFLNTEKHETDYDANGEQLQSQSQLSDSQSLANSTASDDGNSSIRKGVSSFSCSDTASTSAEIMPSTETDEVDAPCIPSNQDSIIEKVIVDPLSVHEVSSGDCIEQAEIHADSAPMGLPINSGVISIEDQSGGLESDDLSLNSGEGLNGPMKSELQTDDISDISSDTTKTEEQQLVYDAQMSSGPVKTEEPPVDDNSEISGCPMTTEEQQANVDDSSQEREEITAILSCEEVPTDEAEVFYPTVGSSDGMDSANALEMIEKEGSETSSDDVVQDEFFEDVSAGNSVDTQVMSPDSVISHAEEHPSAQPLAEFKIFGTCNLVEEQLAEKADDDLSDKYDLGRIDIADSRERDPDGTWEGELLLHGENNVEEGGIEPSLDLLAIDSHSGFPESPDHPSKMDGHAQSDERDIETIQLEAVVEKAFDSSLAENCAQSHEREHEIVQLEAAAERAPDLSMASEAKLSLHHNSNITVSSFTESSEQDFESESPYESILIEKTEDASLFSCCIPSETSLEEKVELQMGEFDLQPRNTPGKSPELEHIDPPSHMDRKTDSNTGFDSCALTLPTHPVDLEEIQAEESDVISLQVGEVTCPEFSSQLKILVPPNLMDHKPDINADIDSGALTLPSHSLDQEEELQADEPDVRSLQMGEVTRESSRSEQDELNETDHVSSATPLSVEASVSELPQSSSHNFDLSEQAKFPLNSAFSGFNVLPEVAQLNSEEMPPLPPLPPMQWRIGKLHHASLASERDGDLQANNFFPPLFPSKPNQLLQPSNRFLPLPDINIQNSYHEDLAGNTVNSTPLLPQMPTVKHGDHRDDFLALGQQQSSDMSAALPVTYNHVRPPHTFPSEEGKIVQPTCNTFTRPITLTPTSMYSSETPHGKVTQIPPQLSTEVSVEKEEDDRSSAVSDMMLVGPPENLVSQSTIEKGQPEHVAPTSEEETASSSSTSVLAYIDDEKPNGNRPMKLPRPRSPLIDAVAAHDKSKLRKVTERVRPEIQKVEERDSLLEQIRTKSFNLKPAVSTRPTVQGPRTNLRVAAILEKANAIRQAFAGSDDDDDDDSWSDS